MKRKILSILLALVLVLSFSLVMAVPVSASPDSAIDGALSPGEWASPTWTITGSQADYNVYLMTDTEALYLALEYLGDDPRITPPTVAINLYIDGNNNDILDALDKAFIFQNRDGLEGVVNWLRVYPAKEGNTWDIPPNYDNPDEYGYRWDTPISPEIVPVEVGISADRKVVEWRILRDFVGATGESFGLAWQAFDSYNWNPPESAPSLGNAENYYDVTTPVDLDRASDGTIDVSFVKIQIAIDAASPGDTISVAAGTYDSSVETFPIVINKSLNLLGAQVNVDPRPSQGGRTGNESIIDADETSSAVIQISASDVEINGFTITGGMGDMVMVEESGSADKLLFRYNILYDDLILYTEDQLISWELPGDEAIQIKNSDGVVMEYNYAYNIKQDAFNLSDSTNGAIRYNEAHDIYSVNAAIYCYGTTNIDIIGNLVYDVPNNDGIKLGDSGDVSTGGIVKDNEVHDAAEDGITIYASGVTVENNTLYNCDSENGALYLYGADNSTVTKNRIYNNDAIGLLIYNSSNVTVTENEIYSNDDTNDTKYSGSAGIWLTSDASSILIHYNSITGNADFGIKKEEAATAVDAKYNWWGGIGGPGGEGLGNGDNVTANVDYDPWLTELPVTVSADGIRSYGSDAIELQVGWNTLSVPCGLKDSADTFDDIQAMGDYLISSGDDRNYLGGYWFDTKTSHWNAIVDSTKLEPGKGFYIRMINASRFPVLYFDGGLYLPSYPIWEGWNLVGSMFGIDKTTDDGLALGDEGDWGVASLNADDNGDLAGDSESHMDKDTALDSLKTAASVVVSPSVPGQLLSWAEVYGTGGEAMCVGEAYWVFMLADGTLAGFEVTPFYFTYTAPAP